MSIKDVSNLSLVDLCSLKGRVAVVTGGAVGLGRAICTRFAEAGASVVVADRNIDVANQTVAMLAGTGHKAMEMDVTDSASVERVAEYVAREYGKLNIWVNNAGIYPVHPTLSMTDDEWAKVISVNLTGGFYGARAAARVMTTNKCDGVIINTQSVVVHKVPAPGLAHYIAAKGGIEAMTRALAFEFGPSNIRVLSIAPTLARTEGTLDQKPHIEAAMGTAGDFHLLYGSQLPLGRIAVPDDIARVALFCASDLSMMLTGSVLSVDGGDLIC